MHLGHSRIFMVWWYLSIFFGTTLPYFLLIVFSSECKKLEIVFGFPVQVLLLKLSTEPKPCQMSMVHFLISHVCWCLRWDSLWLTWHVCNFQYPPSRFHLSFPLCVLTVPFLCFLGFWPSMCKAFNRKCQLCVHGRAIKKPYQVVHFMHHMHIEIEVVRRRHVHSRIFIFHQSVDRHFNCHTTCI